MLRLCEDPCICSHPNWQHYLDALSKMPYCIPCASVEDPKKCWHKFKLDNLKFVEDLAKDRGLI